MANLNSLQSGGYDPYNDDPFPCFEDTDYQWEYQIVSAAGDEGVLAPACIEKLLDSNYSQDELPF